jgi:POT family proton-dependent oligopeptide transporter
MSDQIKRTPDEFRDRPPASEPAPSDEITRAQDEIRKVRAVTPGRNNLAPGEEGSAALPEVALPRQGHPPGLFLLFIVEMWERFSYYGMRAILVLYLIHAVTDADNPGRGWAEGRANYLYGWYVGMAYLAPILGGWIADKLLGTNRSMITGALLITLGHIVLGVTGLGDLTYSAEGLTTFIGGLALIVIGTGFFKPCVSVMVGQLYERHDPRRDGAYTIFYMGINLGAFICAFVCGTLGEKVGWHWGFGAAAVGMIAGLVTYLVGRPRFLANIGLPPRRGYPAQEPSLLWAPLLFIVSLVLAAGFAFLYHDYDLTQIEDVLGNPFVRVGLGVTVLALAAWLVLVQQPGDRGPVVSILIFMLFNAVFWIAFEQAGSTLNVFAERSTDRNLFGWEIPASWFQSINAGQILLFAPLFAMAWTFLGRHNLDPSQPVKIGLGLLFLAGGYVFIVIAGMLNADGARVSMFWLMAMYTFHTLGELCLSPTGLSYVTKAAPVRYVSLLMGIWFISSFLAGYMGGKIASYVREIEQGQIEMPWHLGGRADFFMIFLVSALVAGVLVLLLTPLLKRLMRPGT